MTIRIDRLRGLAVRLGLVGWVLFGLGSAPATGSEAISWRADFRRAEAEARAQGRLLWVQFTGSWCPNCVRLEREAFVNPRVVGHARDSFVPVKLQSEQHEDLVDRFGLTGIPATILIAPGGGVIARHEGYVDAATFRTFLEGALSRSGLHPRPSPPRVTPASVASRGSGAGEPPATRRAAPAEPVAAKLALDGLCPVSLVEGHRMVSGRRTLSLTREGLVYRFADEARLQAFEKWPGRFLPVNGGRCPVAQVDRGEILPGETRWCVLFKDHLFLCASEESRTRFLKNPDRYVHLATADRRLCPHCWGREGFPAPGVIGASPAPDGWRPRPLEARLDPESLRR